MVLFISWKICEHNIHIRNYLASNLNFRNFGILDFRKWFETIVTDNDGAASLFRIIWFSTNSRPATLHIINSHLYTRFYWKHCNTLVSFGLYIFSVVRITNFGARMQFQFSVGPFWNDAHNYLAAPRSNHT